MGKPTREPNPIASASVSDAAAQTVLDGVDAGFDIDDIIGENNQPKIRGDRKFSQEALDEIVNLTNKGNAIPGQSLVSNPEESRPWEKPPTYANPREALEYITALLLQPETVENILRALINGASASDLTMAVLYTKFFEGDISVDVVMLLVEPVMYIIMAMGEEANIKYNIDDNDLDEFDNEEDDFNDKLQAFKGAVENLKREKNIKKKDISQIDTNIVPESILAKIKEQGPAIQSLLGRGEE